MKKKFIPIKPEPLFKKKERKKRWDEMRWDGKGWRGGVGWEERG